MPMPKSVSQTCHERGFALCGYIVMPSEVSAELYAMQGWDFVMIDMEHGSIGVDMAVRIARAVRASTVVPLVRIPKGDYSSISVLLDAGIMGVTAAMINSAADAERLVNSCLYPPLGKRGTSTQTRALMIYGSQYREEANSNLCLFAMIETPEAMRNLDAIASVSGLSGLYFGAGDYAAALLAERPTLSPDALESSVRCARKKVAQACLSRDLIAGTNSKHANKVREFFGEGYRFITLSSDVLGMTSHARRLVSDARHQMQPIG
jgi:4-hydroxy-2-oxoheptanedioate aldolase